MPPKPRKRASAAKAKRLTAPQDPSSSSTPATDHEDGVAICTICAEPARDWAIGSCSHTVCGDCSHRLRVLYDRNTCVMCNVALRQVAVVPMRHYRSEMTFEDVVALPGAFQDKQVEMWFVDRARHQQLRNIRSFKCSHKSCNGRAAQESIFANGTQLRAHARSEHRSIYCEICFAGKKSFVSELQLYPLDGDKNFSSRLRGHMRKEHPQCKFCRRYYLDDEKLYAHLQEAHETCSVCERNGRMHEYYLNFQQLERHYQKEHYICPHESCRGVVFATRIELQTHEHTRHNENSRGARSRALRVNLAELHGDRDPRRSDRSSARDVEIERERQAARRRAFLSSSVVFSGALNFDDSTADPPPGEMQPPAPEPSQPQVTSTARDATVATGAPSSGDGVEEVRRPDDGRFHPLALPRNGDELHARNTILVRTMRSLLDPAAYEQFRDCSGQYHAGKVTADEYYDAAVDAFGVRAAVRNILPELVALLPSPLLREPLLQTCLRRTNTKGSDVGYLGPPVPPVGSTGAGPSSTEAAQSEQFPTLNGGPAPQQVPARVRRFGAPGPEEFPRLGRVNKSATPSQNAPPAFKASSSVASRPQASTSSQATLAKGSSSQPQKTAASVLLQPARNNRIFGSQGAQGSSAVSAGAGDIRLSASSFPSLTPSHGSSQESSSTDVASSNAGETSVERIEGLPSDVSMRVGAVWGGAAASSQARNGKKRGPGKGQGRRPATPPKSTILISSSSDFPNIRESAREAVTTSPASQEPHSQAAPRKSKVLDVVEVSRARRKALEKSSLPKIGGSGYGFAWDRKKAQQKRKEIKSSVAAASTSKKLDSSYQNSFQKASSAESSGELTRREIEVSSGSSTTLAQSTDEIEERSPSLSIAEEASSTGKQPLREMAPFDPYAYLKGDSLKDDAVASFFGGAQKQK